MIIKKTNMHPCGCRKRSCFSPFFHIYQDISPVTNRSNRSTGLYKAKQAQFQRSVPRQLEKGGGGGGDGGVTVSKAKEKKNPNFKVKHCILIMSLITIPPPPLPPFPFSLSPPPPQALWRDKSPPRHSCTVESIDDPLTDSQKPSTNTTPTTTTTTNITTSPSNPWSRKGRKRHKQLQGPRWGSKVQQKAPEFETPSLEKPSHLWQNI